MHHHRNSMQRSAMRDYVDRRTIIGMGAVFAAALLVLVALDVMAGSAL